MNRCLIILAFLCLAFNAGSALKCYTCESCGDPFSNDQGTEEDCSPGSSYCAKVVVDNDVLLRRCVSVPMSLTSEALNGRVLNDVAVHLCNSYDLCNGSGRVSQTSIKMVLLSLFLVLVISVFSR